MCHSLNNKHVILNQFYLPQKYKIQIKLKEKFAQGSLKTTTNHNNAYNLGFLVIKIAGYYMINIISKATNVINEKPYTRKTSFLRRSMLLTLSAFFNCNRD